ncbi:hypothetical protein BVY00_00575 [bacterium G20]|nr:hypothetical protein BVY00_00575 [bacterium G20]
MRAKSGAINLFLTVCLVAVPAVAFLQRQNIYDWYKLHDYKPTAAIATLASADTMTDKSRRIFYVNHPQLTSDSTSFRQDCSITEQTIVLGCYHPNQQGIFVYDVQDPRLSGVEEVTSAHEMLHAAYDRLSTSNKNNVNKMLNDYYQTGLHDQRILDTMDAYKKTEPKDVVNEMHSIFGTEIAQLPPALESYYKQYFRNRAAVVAESQKYEGEFTSRSTKAAQYEAQLNSLKQKIQTEEADLKTQLAKIEADQVRLDSLRSSNQIEAYNGGVASYNAEIDVYNAGVAQYKKDVNRYNALVEQYNAIAGELKQLYGAIDTRLQTRSAH